MSIDLIFILYKRERRYNMKINKVTLFQLFIVFILKTVIAHKINKEKQQQSDISYISDLSQLPTKFGDEDDVVINKKSNESSGSQVKVETNGGHIFEHDDYDDGDIDDDDEDGTMPIGYPEKIAKDIVDYEDNFDTKHPTIDQFGESFGEADATNSLPLFLIEPQSTFVMRNRPAILTCKAAHALQLSFKCSGSSQPPPSTYDSHVDPHTGVQLQEVTATISRELVDEYFGSGPFKCECRAWSPRGKLKTQPVTINVAYIKKQITISPKAIRVEVGGRAEINCNVNATPVAKISWLKNGIPLMTTPSIIMTTEDSILIAHVTMQDMGNYTCVAENIAGKRIADPVSFTVFVDGGWSSWGPWNDCKCSGHPKQGQKRSRLCNSPLPLNSGAPCMGHNAETTPDCLPCSAGRWSTWSDWSLCSTECIQTRHRTCMGINTNATLTDCSGKNVQTAKCQGGNCNFGIEGSNWTIYLGLALIAAVCIATGAGITRLARRKKSALPTYNLARSDMPSEYFPNENKKLTHFQPDLTQNTVSINYEYPLAPHHHLHNHQQSDFNSMKNSMPFPRSNSEHHYDVPHLCNNYMYPLDKISINDSYSSSSYSKRVCSVESLATSTNTSDSAYDQAVMTTATLPVKEPMNSLNNADVIHQSLTLNGGLLKLNTHSIGLLVPEGAIAKHKKQSIILTIVKEDKYQIQIPTNHVTYLSPAIFCGPTDIKLNKPIVLKIPHCAESLSNWQFSLYHSNDNTMKWNKVVTIGEETINTPAFVQIDKKYAYILTEIFGKYVLVGESSNDIHERPACKKLRLFICGPSTVPEFSDCSIRIYIFEDNPGADEKCKYFENEIGGVLLGRSSILYFSDNNQDLCIDIKCAGGWKSKPFGDKQTIPFSHVWSNNSALHCSFTLSRTEHDKCDFKIDVQAMQENNYNIKPSVMSISSFTPLSKEGNCQHSSSSFETMTICSIGSSSANADNNVINTNKFRLTKLVKKQLCKCLDPPTQKGNDWRMLAAHLNVDRYLAYFATKPSPTDQILDLWECRNRDLNAVCNLIEICKNMGRHDAVSILEKIQTPSWL